VNRNQQTALVTGASRGIGRETAFLLAERGVAVFLAADGTVGELADAEAECRSRGAPIVGNGIFDLRVPGQAESMVDMALQKLSRIDILVNNAGIRCRKKFGFFTREDFANLVEVNLAAPFFASQAVLPTMRSQGGGRIIHVASQMGTVASENNALYGITKAAIIHLSQCMAYELAREAIIVNAVSPGPIATQFNLDTIGTEPGAMEQIVSRIPAGRMGQPREIAEVIVFLATSNTTFIQGHNLVIDGGYIIH
jgi:NAD(P)-dependent dehydrogenase (short-subunit alcohol dehydrogenase family)